MGSFKDQPAFDMARIEGKRIPEWLTGRKIYAYRDPLNEGFLVTSIHRRPQDMMLYASDIAQMSEEGYKVAALFFGGLAFSLPAAFASAAYNVPVIGISTGRDVAYESMYYTPNGTPIGIAEHDNLANGLELADRILSVPKGTPVYFVSRGSKQSTDEIQELLESTIGDYYFRTSISQSYDGITIFLAENAFELSAFDRKVDLGIFGLDEGWSYKQMMNEGRNLRRSLVVGRPQNLALFAARIIAMQEPRVNRALYKYSEELKSKAHRRQTAIQPDDFRLPQKQ